MTKPASDKQFENHPLPTIAFVDELRRAGRLREAEGICRWVIEQEPDNAEAVQALGLLCAARRNLSESLALLGRCVALRPEVGRFHANLGSVLGNLGRHAQAADALKRAVELEPEVALYHDNLGVALERLGRNEGAIDSFTQATILRPELALPHSHLGGALRTKGRIDEAAIAGRRALELAPQDSEVLLRLAATLFDIGDQRGAIDCCQRSVAGAASSAAARSTLIFAMQHDDRFSAIDHLREAQRWAMRYGKPPGAGVAPREGTRAAVKHNRRLRLGFISPDLVEHPAARILLPLLRDLDCGGFEAFCYASGKRPADDMTHRLMKLADGWRSIDSMSDAQAAEVIRNDGIDLLVDLSGHMAGNRLTLFALRPAPVQVQWTYPGTTGLAAMDWRITDAASDPPDVGEAQHVERLVRLPCAWPYDPGPLPPFAPPPCLRNGFVTFGCLNRLMKITDSVLSIWVQLLERMPSSRLLLLSGSIDGRNACLSERLTRRGFPKDRVRLIPKLPREQFLRLFHEIDIALDPFPYNGEATTLDGLWSGVPLVTLAGDACVSRRGASHLSVLV